MQELYVVLLLDNNSYRVCFTESGGIPFVGNLQQATELKNTLSEDYPDSSYRVFRLL